MKQIITLLICIAVYANTSKAQDLNTHYLYQMNWYNINPAFTGETEKIKTIINPGTQWVGMDGSPSNSMFGLHSSVNKNMGLGGKVVIDKRGVFNNLTAEMTYSYSVQLTDEHQLSFGISAGIFQTYLNANNIIQNKYTDATDPTTTTQYFNKTHLLSSFGVLYKFKGLEVAASSPHMVVSGRSLSDHLFGMARYNFELKDGKINVIPSLVYQNLTVSPNQLDVGLKGVWNNLLWAQATYKTNKTIVAAMGVTLHNINFGYAYVINQNPLSVISSGSYEVLISFTFDKKAKKNKGEDTSTRLSSILSDLKTMSAENTISVEVQQEIAKIQGELSTLIATAKANGNTSVDKNEIERLEKRISALKAKL